MRIGSSLKTVGFFSALLLVLSISACDSDSDSSSSSDETAESSAAQETEAAAEADGDAITLAPGFSPNPTTVRGEAGGARQGSSWTGTAPYTDCRGYMAEEPSQVLVLSEDFDRLKVVASHDTDLTMVVEGPSGTWCNDDFEGLDPGLDRDWPAGTYRIFVGTYSEGVTANYTLRFEEAEVLEAPETSRGELAPGFLPDPYTVESVAGGPRAGHEWTGTGDHTGCVGQLPEEPQHILELEEFSSLRVFAEPTGHADLTMVVEGPSGTWCNDDFQGLDPGFNTEFPAGTYRFFVGVYSGEPAPYTFNVTEL